LIQTSADFAAWVGWTNVTLTNTTAQCAAPSGTTAPRRFYRAVSQ
jgi:hypothetical protein